MKEKDRKWSECFLRKSKTKNDERVFLMIFSLIIYSNFILNNKIVKLVKPSNIFRCK